MKVIFKTQKVYNCQLHPFILKENKWPEDKAIQDIYFRKKDSKDQCGLKKALYIIDGSENPEL